ncbi:MAG: 30S ribosomal protein S17 [Acidobacteria bacterium]|nr:MAG: 30S ribosomal protein S17 [Acidobacteriota bacterium]
MFRRKKKEEAVEPTPEPQAPVEEPGSTPVEEAAASAPTIAEDSAAEAAPAAESVSLTASAEATSVVSSPTAKGRGHRVQKVGTVSSDKMQKTVVVRVDRLVLHPKYRRYVRRTSRFMAHDDLGATTGDRVRIVETRPLSARKRWRVVEIVQKAAK